MTYNSNYKKYSVKYNKNKTHATKFKVKFEMYSA